MSRAQVTSVHCVVEVVMGVVLLVVVLGYWSVVVVVWCKNGVVMMLVWCYDGVVMLV